MSEIIEERRLETTILYNGISYYDSPKEIQKQIDEIEKLHVQGKTKKLSNKEVSSLLYNSETDKVLIEEANNSESLLHKQLNEQTIVHEGIEYLASKEEPYLKLYIAVLDEVNAFMVPTLVAHSMLGAHLKFSLDSYLDTLENQVPDYYSEWLNNSFRKCVVRVNRKEFEKIKQLDKVYLGHENTTLGGEKSCAVVYPVWSTEIPNVLKFAKLWAPGNEL